ncbi:MAG: LCP family protein [Oscillospiraceae bacterium]|nr:LCP family protein [Oscillospiraceae bacterium]
MPSQKKHKKKNQAGTLSEQDTAVNVCIKIISVLMTLMLIVAMVLNAPIIQYTATDNFNQITQISIMKYFKTRKPMQYIEGNIKSMTQKQVEIREDVDSESDDGLDLKQTIEGQFTVLFLGFDSTENGSGHLHDVNYLIQFNLWNASMSILQIPRDTYTPSYTNAYTHKFNSVYTFGNEKKSNIQRVVDCVQENYGVPVDAYVTTTCDNVAAIIDIVGGVPIDMPYPIVFEADKVIPNGEQVLSGEEAEWFLRFRYGYQDGDIGRVQAQRIFMAAAMKKAISMNSVQIFSAVNKIYKQELIATDMSMEDISRLADLAGTIDMANVNVFMLPGEYTMADDQAIWSVHKTAALEMMNQYFRTQQVPLSAKKSTIVEYIPEGEYQSTAYDNMAGNLQDIDENGGADPQLKNNYKDKYDRDYDERSQKETESLSDDDEE